MQEAAPSCRACAGTLCPPAELLQPDRVPGLELFNWRAMPAPLLIFLLSALVGGVLFGPALVKLLVLTVTGSVLLAEVALVMVMVVPSVRMLFRAELPPPPAPRLLSAMPPWLLRDHGEVRRGKVRASTLLSLDGDACVAAQLAAHDLYGTYVWRVRSCEFELVTDEGPLRVCGTLALEGTARVVETAPEGLALPGELPLPRWLELLVLRDGDEVELRGPLEREQIAAGYRDTAELQVMRGTPGNPVQIRLSGM